MNRNDIINLIEMEFPQYIDVMRLLNGDHPIYPNPARMRNVVAFLTNKFSEYGKWNNVAAIRIARELGYSN